MFSLITIHNPIRYNIGGKYARKYLARAWFPVSRTRKVHSEHPSVHRGNNFSSPRNPDVGVTKKTPSLEGVSLYILSFISLVNSTKVSDLPRFSPRVSHME